MIHADQANPWMVSQFHARSMAHDELPRPLHRYERATATMQRLDPKTSELLRRSRLTIARSEALLDEFRRKNRLT